MHHGEIPRMLHFLQNCLGLSEKTDAGRQFTIAGLLLTVRRIRPFNPAYYAPCNKKEQGEVRFFNFRSMLTFKSGHAFTNLRERAQKRITGMTVGIPFPVGEHS